MNILLKSIVVILVSSIGTSFAFAQSTAANGPIEKGNVTSFASIGAMLFAGSYEGVFRSANNGASWMSVNAGLTNTQITALASVGPYLFAGTGDGGGIFISTDNGSKWQGVNNGFALNGNNVTSINALVSSGTTLYAGTDSGAYLSTDYGTTRNGSIVV
jgi:ligand-binding sensor domain-containing protein